MKKKHSFFLGLFTATTLILSSGALANNHLFVPGQPCTGCTVEISDHSGVIPTSKNAVYRVQNPVTPNGIPTWLELYSPDMAKLQNCLNMVSSVQGPTPFSVQLKASEYKLANSSQVVFLIDKCRQVQGQAIADRPMAGGNMNNSGPRGQLGQVRPGGPNIKPTPGGKLIPGDRPQIIGSGESGAGGMMSQAANCGSGTPPASTSCATTSGGWQTISNVRPGMACQLLFDDSQAGPQQVIYDNSYSVSCIGGNHMPAIYVGNTPTQSNWNSFVNNTATCQMKTGPLPSGNLGVVTIVCP